VTSVEVAMPVVDADQQLSVLCWRGWCDHEFKIRDVASIISWVSGTNWPIPEHLPTRECPTPGTCQCVCHDVRPDKPGEG